jgi:hypothetical protein
MTTEDLVYVIQEFKRIQIVPEDPYEQLSLVISNAYEVWSDKKYRVIREETLLLPSDLYPAVCLQAVTFGGLGIAS